MRSRSREKAARAGPVGRPLPPPHHHERRRGRSHALPVQHPGLRGRHRHRLSRALLPASVRSRRRRGERSAKAMTVLDDILAAKRDEVAARRAATPPSALRERPLYAEPRRGFRAALAARKRPAIIAELKRASPSRGEMRAAYDPAAIACGYAAAGAAALSVLTDGPFFGGALEHLAAARAASGLPCLRKDFLIDPYQIDEARAFGADAVLLVVGGVTARQGADLLAAARAAGADFVGLNFHPASPRHVTPEAAREIAQAVPGTALVGVFVDAPRASVEEIAARVGLSALQFHGDEDADYCRGWGWRTIKAIRARPGADLAALAARCPTDYLLLDSFVAARPGGTGVALDPARAAGLPAARLFVAGGLRPDTVAEVVCALRPFAVDVAAGVEASPGRKDHAQVEEFIRRAKDA